jgi:hypothetical protein
MSKKIRFNVKWDGAGNRLPKKFVSDVEIPSDIDCNNEDELIDFLSDWLSDEFGFCHLGFTYEMI